MPDERVTSDRFPFLPIRLLVAGRAIEVEALLDTGFDGAVIVPANLLASDVPSDMRGRWTLADGSEVDSPMYLGVVRIGHLEPVRVAISALGHEALLGRMVSDRFHITLDHGKRIVVEP